MGQRPPGIPPCGWAVPTRRSFELLQELGVEVARWLLNAGEKIA